MQRTHVHHVPSMPDVHWPAGQPRTLSQDNAARREAKGVLEVFTQVHARI